MRKLYFWCCIGCLGLMALLPTQAGSQPDKSTRLPVGPGLSRPAAPPATSRQPLPPAVSRHPLPAAAEGPQVYLAPARWRGVVPSPGQLVKLRVAYEVARQLRDSHGAWRLMSNGQELPAQAFGWAVSASATASELAIVSRENPGAGITAVVVDRGGPLAQFNQLALELEPGAFTGSASISGSLQQSNYTALGEPQLVVQNATANQPQLTTLHVDPQRNRFLRIELRGATPAIVKAVRPLPSWPIETDETSVAVLSPYPALTADGHSAYTLRFRGPSMPVTGIDISAAAPGAWRVMQLCNLADDRTPDAALAEWTWADAYTAAGLTRSEHAYPLPGLDPREGLVLLLPSDQPPLKIDQVSLSCQASWIVCECPVDEDLQLQIGAQAGTKPLRLEDANLGAAMEAGDFNQLQAASALPQTAKAPPAAADQWFGFTVPPLWRIGIYASAAVLLLALGIALGRRRSASSEQ